MRIRRLAIALALGAISGLVVPSVAASSAHAQTATELTAKRDELLAALAQVDAATNDALRRRDEARTTIARVETRLPGNEIEQQATAANRRKPTEARRQLALEIYMRGDPRGRQFLDSLVEGTFTLDPLRENVLFGAAEDYTKATLAQLDEAAKRLTAEREQLVADRQAAGVAEAAAGQQLDQLGARRTSVEAELAKVSKQLQRAEANANGDPLTGLPVTQRRPVLAVKIDNHPDARPQAGLTEADLVIEELVEGGITRFVALFHSADAPVVGPVRSGRTSDLIILANLNRALFGSSGGNVGVLAALREANLSSVIESRVPSAYYRDNSREAPHNLYTSTAALYAADPGAGQPPHLFSFLGRGETPSGGRPVSSVSVRVGDETAVWHWNGSGWNRRVFGQDETDYRGVAIAPTNLIVQFTDYGISDADASSPEAKAVGSGDVWILTAGQLFEGRWLRASADAVTQYTNAAGEDISLQPGRSWIVLPRPGRATVLG